MEGAALLFGNALYRNGSFPALLTPRTDVEHLGRRLQALNFDTLFVHDADRQTMGEVLALFREHIAKLPPRAPVLVHFAGHGMQRAGENYLAPVDAGGGTVDAVLLSCIRLSEIMDLLCWRDDQQKLITIDACRTNTVPGVTRGTTLGLAGESARRYESVRETFVLYATEPGNLARDGADEGSSPFCRGLLHALKKPHRPIAMLAAEVTDFVCTETGDAQVPWGGPSPIRRLWPFLPPTDGGEMAVPTPAIVAPSHANHPAPTELSDQYIAERGHLIHMLKAKDSTGRWAYYFVLVEPEDEAAFLEALKGTGELDFEEYGRVIASSYGEEPTEEVRNYLKDRFGFSI